MSEPAPTQPDQRLRWRWLASWLPAVVLVPATLVVAVELSQADTDAPMDAVLPLEPGTTWVYDVFDHERPSGTRLRQVLGPSQLLAEGELREAVRLSSSYDEYPGRGHYWDEAYLGVHGDELLQYGLVTANGSLDVAPPAPAYRLPAEEGTAWSYAGEVDGSPLTFEAEVTDTGDVAVQGHTFTGCTEWTTVLQVEGADGETTPETLVDWTCPGIGTVRSSDTWPAGDVEITEELRAFRSPERSWTAAGADLSSQDGAGPARSTGFDEQRSFHVPSGQLSRTLAWTETREGTSRLSPASGDGTVVTGEQDGLVTARDIVTGELRWQLTLAEPIVASPAIAGDVVLVADGHKNLWALRLLDGSARWVHHFDDVVGTVPTVSDDVAAVVVEDGTIVAVDVDDGEQIWSRDIHAIVRTPPALNGENTLVVGDETGTLTALDMATGDTAWSASLLDGLEQGPVVSGDQVIAVDANGVITSFDADDGDTQWQTSGDFPEQPLAAGSGRLVTVGLDRVDAFDLEDGDRRWSIPVPDGVDVAPAIVGDEVVITADEGRVTVLSLDDGSTADTWDLPHGDGVSAAVVRSDPALVDDVLVLTMEVTSSTLGSMVFAYPVAEDDERPAGVRIGAGSRLFLLPAAAPPILGEGSVHALDYTGGLYRNDGDGDPVPLADGIQPPIGLASAQGVTVVPRGEEVVALDEDGTELWSKPVTGGGVGNLPAVDEDTAFVPLNGLGLAAFGLETGELSWTTTVLGYTGVTSPLPLPDGDVAFAGGSLARYDAATGRELWSLGGDLDAAVAYGPLAYAEGTIYAILVSPDDQQPSGELSRLVAVDASTGEVRWTRPLDGAQFLVGPAAGHDTVVVIDRSSRASGVDAATGEELWSFAMSSVPAGTPSIHDGVVALAERGRPEDLLQRDFRIVFLDVRTGSFVGAYEPPDANDAVLPTVGSAPDGTVLVPSTTDQGQVVVMLEARR